MFRPSLEVLETRETPSASRPLPWFNAGPAPVPAGDSRPVEEVAFVYHKIDIHAGADIHLKGSMVLENSPAAKNETITIDQNHTETAAVRHRTFAVVDRTQGAHDSVWIDLGTPAAGDAFYGGGVYKSADAGRTW